MELNKIVKVDEKNKNVDFIILQMNPCIIQWNKITKHVIGKQQKINTRTLKQMKNKYTWATNF